MRNHENIVAVLFDKDGTLFELETSWMQYCDKMFDYIADEDGALRNDLAVFCGYDVENRKLLGGSLIVGGSIDQLCDGWAAMSSQFSHDDLLVKSTAIISELDPAPICDLRDLTESLRSQGLVLGIITNDLEATARSQLERAKIFEHFAFVSGSDSGYRPKPEPDMILGFCNAKGIAPENVAVVGDSLHDLNAANNAGAVLRIAVLTGPANHDELAHCADYVLENVAELPRLLSSVERSSVPAIEQCGTLEQQDH